MSAASLLALLLSGVGALALMLIASQLQDMRARISRIEAWIFGERHQTGD